MGDTTIKQWLVEAVNTLSTQEVRKPISPLHATSRHLKWHEVAWSGMLTVRPPLEVAWSGMLTVRPPLEVAWSGMLTVRHATWSGMRHLKRHEVACSRCATPLEVACATWSGIRHSKWHTPLEVAWSGMLTVGHYDYDCCYDDAYYYYYYHYYYYHYNNYCCCCYCYYCYYYYFYYC